MRAANAKKRSFGEEKKFWPVGEYTRACDQSTVQIWSEFGGTLLPKRKRRKWK